MIFSLSNFFCSLQKYITNNDIFNEFAVFHFYHPNNNDSCCVYRLINYDCLCGIWCTCSASFSSMGVNYVGNVLVPCVVFNHTELLFSSDGLLWKSLFPLRMDLSGAILTIIFVVYFGFFLDDGLVNEVLHRRFVFFFVNGVFMDWLRQYFFDVVLGDGSLVFVFWFLFLIEYAGISWPFQ